MDSLSFNRTSQSQSINKQNNVSFTGQKSIIDAAGTKTYRFYAPPYDDSKYLAALELVSIENGKDSKGNPTGEFKATGTPVLLDKSINCFDSSAKGLSNLPFDVTEEELKQYQINDDVVGYRFVLLDKETYKKTKNLDAAIGAAKWTDDNDYKHTTYLLDSGKIAAGYPYENYSYFSKKQGFVNKTGPMYHIMPDSYNVEKGNEDFVRTTFNKAGGNIQGIISKIKEENGELAPYEMIITTSLFGGDDVSSHGYWTANPYQIASVRGTLEDFKELQTAVFDAGKTYVTDGAFTSFGLEAPQLQHVLKWGKESPFYHWIKFDGTDAPNGTVKLGILPDTIVSPNNKNAKPEDYKKTQTLLNEIRFKVVNPKYIESKEGDRFSAKKINPDYDETKPTYIQLFDNRLAGSKADDLTELITVYEKQNTDNHYDIATHQDSVQPFYFEVDPADARFQTRGASLKELQEEGYVSGYDKFKKPVIQKGYDTFFQMDNYSITTKSQAGGANTWDGEVDLLKANISNPSNNPDDIIGNKQVKNHYYNIASYWTKLTDDALIEHIAKVSGEEGKSALNKICKKHKMTNAEINNLANVINTDEFNKNFNAKFKGKNDAEILTDAIVNFPLESIEFAPDLTAALSMPQITPRPKEGINDRTPKTELLNTMSDNAQSLYKDSMQKYAMSVLKELDAKMPGGQKLFKGGNAAHLTDYGKFVTDIVTADIMKYGVVKALFPEDNLVEFDAGGNPEYDEDLKYKGLVSLEINEPNGPENEANALLKKLIKGFNEIENEDNSDLVDALYTRFKNVKLDDIKMARAIVNQTGAGLNWRFDAAKDVADLDKRRANDPNTSFEDCWDNVIDFWGGFIENIRKYNPAAYTIAEVTNLWEFSRWQSSGKSLFALKDMESLETLSTPQQKYALYEFYMANKDSLGTGNIPHDIQKSLENKKITPKELSKNPNLISDKEFIQLRNYFGITKENGNTKIDAERASDAMQRSDFGKYINPNIAERMLYEKTGATTGSNYDTFYGLYPELFGQNFEFGYTSDNRLYNMKSFEDGLKGFFSNNSPQFINHSHIFVNNHDKPRPLHCMALDMELFLSDFKSHTEKSEERPQKEAEFKSRAKAVTRLSDDSKLDTVSSMAVAVGEKYLKMFEDSYKDIISDAEFNTIKQAIADLSQGKFLNQTAGSMQRSRTFGFLPFDVTLKDVIQQARYLSETKGMKWNISDGKSSDDKELSEKETKLYNETFAKLAPDTEKLSAMLRMMMFSVGIPTLFAGDEMAHSGYETPTKNVELAIRNIIHHSWLNDGPEGKKFVKDLYKHTTAAANVHKMNGLSALADGSPLIVPQNNDKDGEASRTALFKYNDKGSSVLVVYSNNQMDTKNRDPKANLNKETDKVSHIDLEYLDAYGSPSGKTVAKDGDRYKKLEYDPKSGQYTDDGKTYKVENGKLVREGMITASGHSNPNIELDDVANVFYKIN